MCHGLWKGWGLGGGWGWTGVTHTAPPRPSDECGIVAQIAGPLAAADISAYYISTFNFDHALVSPLAGEGALGRGGGGRAALTPPCARRPTGARGWHRQRHRGPPAPAGRPGLLRLRGQATTASGISPCPLASRDFSKLCAPALGCSRRGAPPFLSVYGSCKQTLALHVGAACLPNAGDVVLGASSRKPSTLPAGPRGLHIPCLRPEPPPSPRCPQLGCLTQQRSSDRAFPSWSLQEKYFYTSLSPF